MTIKKKGHRKLEVQQLDIGLVYVHKLAKNSTNNNLNTTP
ncbi:hypothetical protein NTGM5_100010 [Candidatus Nitrotoga sp. M5]|nr:hypothetical protein NTGM5_100010 [Candidatus Nitrotoga sp. M5]